ncbi:MAG: HlyD family efflux transporter periplasmic adaptor subunit [Bacteroidetes bacterium]|nr:MAG: HlyD family efflux transporter periplasmic adaptor subunit [Bacteroidota bacterium]
MARISLILILGAALWLPACGPEEGGADAYGNFEAEEVIVSAESNGRLMALAVEEGQDLVAGQVVGYVDTSALYLQKQQLRSRIRAVLSKQQAIAPQARVFEEQKANLRREIARFEKLVADGAATPKQLDDLRGQLELVERQEIAQITALETANRGINAEVQPLLDQIAIIDDQVRRATIRNPRDGRVLVRYAEADEITGFGKPLYKLADTRELILRAYVSGDQLSQVQIGSTVNVRVDAPDGGWESLAGKVTWVSEEAEFTPKVIQTKEERVSMVYAMKVLVPNDGRLKIGMPGEVMF